MKLQVYSVFWETELGSLITLYDFIALSSLVYGLKSYQPREVIPSDAYNVISTSWCKGV